MIRIYNLLGLALKARLLVSGTDICEKKLQKKNLIKLIIVAVDASENTKKFFFNKCLYRGVKVVVFGEKKLLGSYIGKDERSVVGILDIGFANKLEELIESENNNGGDAYG